MVTGDKVSFYNYLRLIIATLEKDVYCFLMQIKKNYVIHINQLFISQDFKAWILRIVQFCLF
jgi:hypothetical protein